MTSYSKSVTKIYIMVSTHCYTCHVQDWLLIITLIRPWSRLVRNHVEPGFENMNRSTFTAGMWDLKLKSNVQQYQFCFIQFSVICYILEQKGNVKVMSASPDISLINLGKCNLWRVQTKVEVQNLSIKLPSASV